MSALSANNLILEVGKAVETIWAMRKRKKRNKKIKIKNITERISFALSALLFLLEEVYKTVPNMDLTILNSNVSSAAILRNGFAGVILTFVSLVILDRTTETMFQGRKSQTCQSVKVLKSAHLRSSIQTTVRSTH